jgi:hypothetical protein
LELEGPFSDNLLNALFYDAEGEKPRLDLWVGMSINKHIMKIEFKLKVVFIHVDEAIWYPWFGSHPLDHFGKPKFK